MKSSEPVSFLAGAWAGAAPLLLWAFHFAANYVAVAAVCTSAVRSGRDAPPDLQWALLAGTAVSLVVLAVLGWRAGPPCAQSHYLPTVRRVCVVLAMIGVAWTGLPLAMLPTCSP